MRRAPRSLLPLLPLLAAFGCPSPPAPPAPLAPLAPPPPDLVAVRACLAGIASGVTLTVRNDEARDGPASACFAWLEQQVPGSRGHGYAYVLRRVDGGDSSAYAVKRAAAQGRLKPGPGRSYVTLRYMPDGLACPELHGVIDPEAPSLLAYWSEGG